MRSQAWLSSRRPPRTDCSASMEWGGTRNWATAESETWGLGGTEIHGRQFTSPPGTQSGPGWLGGQSHEHQASPSS